ncbi:MAG TPA: cytochrome c [Hyphomicrobiaceae bacterium]|jgi:mono/diheme cytochrome c family protein|nr:cytochrome c [Hyphomicrobiaceae bacterium]
MKKLGALGCALVVNVVALGQGVPGDVQRGHDLSVGLCTGCHSVERQVAGPVTADVPTFAAIAARPGMNAEVIAGRIVIPHPAMPNVPLSAAEIRDIATYIMSLKQAK